MARFRNELSTPTIARAAARARVRPLLRVAQLALAAAFLALAPSAGYSQGRVIPNGGTYSSSTVYVEIHFCSQYDAFDEGTLSVTVNGVDVAGNFGGTGFGSSWCVPSPEGAVYSAVVAGTITLAGGSNALSAQMRDYSWNYDYQGATFTRPMPSVTPDGGSGPSVLIGSASSYGFTVLNPGPGTLTYNLAGQCGTGHLQSCNASQPQVTLGGGGSTTVNVSYTGVSAGSSSVYLTATEVGSPTLTDNGYVSVVVAPKPVATVQVSSTASFLEIGQNASATARTFAGDGEELFGRTVTWSGSKVSASPGSGYSTTVTGQTAGAGSITATSEGVNGGANIAVVDGSERYAAGIALAYADRMRDVGRCVAACFAATATYSTPAYRSIDVARGVTLLYRSDRARPIVTVQLDALDYSTPAANTLSLRLQRSDGSFVTFVNASTELYFQGGSGATRLVAQFNATSLSTQAPLYTAIVTSRWADGVVRQSSGAVRVMIVNGGASAFGAGWEIAGLQKATFEADGTVMIASGDGSVSHFGACASTCQLPSPTGDFSTLHRLANGTYERRYPDGGAYWFSANGQLAGIRDRLSNYTMMGYDGSGRLTSITDPAGYAITIGYDGSGKLSTITTPGVGGATRASTFTVNGSGDLTFAQDPDGIKNFNASYTEHKLQSLTDRRGGVWHYTYSTADGGLEHMDAPSIAIHLAGNGSPRTTVAAPRRTMFARFAEGQGISVATAIPRNADEVRAWVRNPRNHTTYLTLNWAGQPTQIDYPTGPSSTAQYNGSGQPLQTISPSGHRIDYTWTGVNLTKVQDITVGTTVNAAYEATYNRPDSIWGHTVKQKFTYNDGARTFTSQRGSHPVTTYAFDTYGRITRVVDPGGHVDSTFYGGSGLRNTDSASAPGARRTRLRYDVYGRVVAQVNPEGQRDSATYDPVNRQLTGTDANNQTTTFAYDSLFLRSVTDARSQVYAYVRNALGWVEQETRPGSSAIVTAYDSSGNVVLQTNRQGLTTTATYDALGRDSTRNANGDVTTYSYLSATASTEGRFTASNAESADTIWMDAKDRVTRTTTGRPGNRWYQFTYTYNTDGTLSSTQAQYPGGWRSYSRGYNATNAVELFSTATSLGPETTTLNPGTSNEDLATSITYNTFPTPLTETRTFSSLHSNYDLGFNISQINAAHGAELTLDLNGRILERAHPGVSWLRTYEYDNVGRLANQKRYSVAGRTCSQNGDKGFECTYDRELLQTDNFSYDAVGNHTYGVTLQIPGNRVLTANSLSFTYDNDGNVTQKSGGPLGTQTLGWNALGQLTSVTTASTTVTFGYDAFGRRVRKTVNGVSSSYVHDGDDLFMEVDNAGATVAQYTYWGLDTPHSMHKNGETYYFIQDPVGGSVRALVRRSDNSVQATYTYSMFGQAETIVDNVGNSMRFAGREYDSETELYFNRARYYDPSIGRFISEDPIGIDGGINLYAYAGNDPANARDPYGLECQWVLVAGATVEWGFGRVTKLPAYYRQVCKEGSGPGDMGGRMREPRGRRRSGAPFVPMSISCNASLALDASGFGAQGREFTLIREGGAEWRGANGQWYSKKWGGNQWTGGRNAVISSGRFFKAAGATLGGIGFVFSAVEFYDSYSRGDTHGMWMNGLDMAATGLAITLGPPGVAVAVAWLAARTFLDCGGQ